MAGCGGISFEAPRLLKPISSRWRVSRRHSMTSSAMASTDGGMAIPIVLAVLPSLDDLLGTSDQRRRNIDGELPGDLEIDDQIEFGGLHDRQVSGFFTF